MRMYTSAKRGAISRKIDFWIALQDIIDLYAAADGRCMATGIAFSDERKKGDRTALWKPSLDRIDSSKGYIAGNVRIVCTAFNLSAQERGDDVFERLAEGFLSVRRGQK